MIAFLIDSEGCRYRTLTRGLLVRFLKKNTAIKSDELHLNHEGSDRSTIILAYVAIIVGSIRFHVFMIFSGYAC